MGISPLVTEEALGYVCAKRRIDPDTPYLSLDERDADLAEGTMYYWLSNLPVGGSTEKVADGGWSRSEGGWTVSKANIEEWLRKYRSRRPCSCRRPRACGSSNRGGSARRCGARCV